MEKYHKTRYFSPGPTNDDVRLQKEMFIRLNGPPIGVADSLCRWVADRLDAKPTAAYSALHPTQRDKKVSKVIKKIMNVTPGFFKWLCNCNCICNCNCNCYICLSFVSPWYHFHHTTYIVLQLFRERAWNLGIYTETLVLYLILREYYVLSHIETAISLKL